MNIKKLFTVVLCLTIMNTIFSANAGNNLQQKPKRRCATMEVLDQTLKEKPELRQKLEAMERDLQQKISQNQNNQNSQRVVVTIPVVVHIVYNTTSQNISDAQIQSQITVLNNDFRKKAGTAGYNTNPVGADAELEFCLATKDPSGSTTTGITRTYTSQTGFTFNNQYVVKQASTGKVGWDYTKYLNLWVCYMTDGTLGYATFPGTETTYDGVVIDYKSFGTTGTAAYPYNGGRTATHEIGHWMNLYHIWGDAYCGDDLVSDTPPSTGSNGGCPTGKTSNCSGTTTDMIQNYMDYTDDACMNIITIGQKARVRATIDGTRASLKTSAGCSGTTTTTYCASNGQSVADEYIAKVQFNTINNTTGATAGGYNNYTAISTNVNRGTVYPITLTPGYTGSAYPEYFRVWIDYNNDKDFDDAGELAYDAGATATAVVTGNITIPSTATLATTRMRVSMKYNGAQTQCESFQYGEVEDYSVVIQGTATCGTPSGLASSSITSSSATVSWTAVSGAGSYNIRYRINGSATWTNTTSASTSLGLTGLSANTMYEFQVQAVCSGTGGAFSASATFTTTAATATYCSSNGQSQADEWIANVKFGTINNTTTASAGGYGNYTAISTDVAAGSSTTIYLKPGYTASAYPEYFRVWIDLNNDKDFIDAGELVYDAGATTTTSVSGNITIPSATALGTKRMRVSMKYNAAPTECESFQYGEVEDYSVKVIQGTTTTPPKEIQVGTGTATNNTLVYDTYYMDHRFQMIVTKAELQAAGWISGLNYIGYVAFQTASASTQVMNSFTIKIKNISGSAFANTTFLTSGTTVYTANYTATANGWNTHTLSSPFQYDGVSNLLVEVCFNNSTYTTSSYLYGSTQSAYKTLALRIDVKDAGACANTTGTLNYFRPNVKLKFMSTASGRFAEADFNPEPGQSSNDKVTIYPNPTGGYTRLTYSLDKDTQTHTEVFDIKGIKVFEWNKEVLPAGVITKELDFNSAGLISLSSGYYIIRITTEHSVINRKFVLTR